MLAALLVFASASLAWADVVQQRDVRVGVRAQIAPFRLPRAEPAPISVFVSAQVANPAGGIPPQLRRMNIEINRHGLLESRGLPRCTKAELAATSTEDAIERCGSALIGSGQFWASIVLPDQGAYPTRGRLLVFNGKDHDRRALLVHIYTSDPFDTSFVIVFGISKIDKGDFGTELNASLPRALGSWGYVKRIKLTLKRRYRYRGEQLSYFNSACPAAKGFRSAPYSIARATLDFGGKRALVARIDKVCGVKGR